MTIFKKYTVEIISLTSVFVLLTCIVAAALTSTTPATQYSCYVGTVSHVSTTPQFRPVTTMITICK